MGSSKKKEAPKFVFYGVFKFGQNPKIKNCTFQRAWEYWVEIECGTLETAREIMRENFGDNFDRVFHPNQFSSDAKKHYPGGRAATLQNLI